MNKRQKKKRLKKLRQFQDFTIKDVKYEMGPNPGEITFSYSIEFNKPVVRYCIEMEVV